MTAVAIRIINVYRGIAPRSVAHWTARRGPRTRVSGPAEAGHYGRRTNYNPAAAAAAAGGIDATVFVHHDARRPGRDVGRARTRAGAGRGQGLPLRENRRRCVLR